MSALDTLFGRELPNLPATIRDLPEIIRACDCHKDLYWAKADLAYRVQSDTWECPIPDPYAVDTSRPNRPFAAVRAVIAGFDRVGRAGIREHELTS